MLNIFGDFYNHLRIKLLIKINFFKNTIRVSNGLYPDLNRRSVGTEQGQNYLQMLSADKERVGNLGNNEYKSGKIQMKDVKLIRSQDDVKYTNNINLKKKENNLTII